MTRTALAVARAAAAERAQICHLHDPELLAWTPLLRWSGATVVFDMHEHTPVALTTKDWLPLWARLPVSRVVRGGERLLLAHTPVIFAEDAYAADYPWVRRSTVVLNMPPSETLAGLRGPKHAIFTLGYLGAVEPRRGARVMLEAAALLARRGCQVALELVGSVAGPFQAEIRTWQEKARFPLAVHGRVPPDAGWAKLARCQVGLAVLEATRNNQMSYPTKFFEYMALGLPVITSDFPLYRAVIADHGAGLCIDPHSPQALADAVEWLIDHPEEATAMGQRGREAALRRFNWAYEADKLLRFYESLIAVPTRRGVGRRVAPS